MEITRNSSIMCQECRFRFDCEYRNYFDRIIGAVSSMLYDDEETIKMFDSEILGVQIKCKRHSLYLG